jgi:hypothetical protein
MKKIKVVSRDMLARPMHGQFRLKVYRKGKLIETYEDHNLIVDGAKAALALMLAGQGDGKNVTSIAFGTRGDVPVPEDTEITEPFTKAVTSISFPATGQVQFNWNLLTTEANGKAILEFGLLLADGTLFARKTRAEPINKDSDIALEGQWLITL